jgi:dihydropteroate synthase
VAGEAIAAGADMINDVSGGRQDAQMFELVAQLKVPYILMHSKGNPQTMQSLAQYNNLLNDLMEFFGHKLDELKRLGVYDVIIDPGFGFAKTINQNFEVLRNLEALSLLGRPVLAGLSRKSMIWKTLNTTAEYALNGTTALHMLALEQGANILRVHDVKAASETITLWKKACLQE